MVDYSVSIDNRSCILKSGPYHRKVILFLSSFKTSEKLFVIFSHKVDNHTSLEVEFSAESGRTQRVVGTLENEYTLSVSAPGKYLHWDTWQDAHPPTPALQCWYLNWPYFLNLLPRYACWSGVARHARRPVQRQLAASHILYAYGRNKSLFGKCYRSCELHVSGPPSLANRRQYLPAFLL